MDENTLNNAASHQRFEELDLSKTPDEFLLKHCIGIAQSKNFVNFPEHLLTTDQIKGNQRLRNAISEAIAIKNTLPPKVLTSDILLIHENPTEYRLLTALASNSPHLIPDELRTPEILGKEDGYGNTILTYLCRHQEATNWKGITLEGLSKKGSREYTPLNFGHPNIVEKLNSIPAGLIDFQLLKKSLKDTVSRDYDISHLSKIKPEFWAEICTKKELTSLYQIMQKASVRSERFYTIEPQIKTALTLIKSPEKTSTIEKLKKGIEKLTGGPTKE
jgi:hypothetical protein